MSYDCDCRNFQSSKTGVKIGVGAFRGRYDGQSAFDGDIMMCKIIFLYQSTKKAFKAIIIR